MFVEPIYDREQVADDEREMFDRVVARQNSLVWHDRPPEEAVGPYYGLLMHSPRIADLLSALAIFFRTRGETVGSFSHADREWVDIVLGKELGSNSVVRAHTPDAIAVGVRPEAIRAVWTGREDELTARERELAAFIRATIHGRVTPHQFASVEALLGRRGAVEYAACITWLVMTTRNLQALGFPDPTDHEVSDLVERAVAGTAEIPDPRQRVPALEATAI